MGSGAELGDRFRTAGKPQDHSRVRQETQDWSDLRGMTRGLSGDQRRVDRVLRSQFGTQVESPDWFGTQGILLFDPGTQRGRRGTQCF